MASPQQPEFVRTPIPGVKNLITIGSGKGGVGKTTVSVNLALAMAQSGVKVGLLDADVYGPNVPLMMGVRDTPYAQEGRILPIEQHGVKLMSMGFLNPGDKPLIWRGPMLHSVMQQFLRQVEWGELDFLLIDLPPGTGDVALSLIQTAPITGSVVVSTPSEVALEDARKAVLMFRQVKVELLGIVENMSYLVVPETGQTLDVFGSGGAERTAQAMDVPFLGKLPLHPQIRIGGDSGRPVALLGESDPQAAGFYHIARQLIERCAQQARKGPSFTVEE